MISKTMLETFCQDFKSDRFAELEVKAFPVSSDHFKQIILVTDKLLKTLLGNGEVWGFLN